jgi:hypothetical protein
VTEFESEGEGYGLDDFFFILDRKGILFVNNSGPDFGTIDRPLSWTPRAPFRRIKRPKHETDYLPTFAVVLRQKSNLHT